MLYLDYAATSLIKPQAVSREMLRAMTMAASPGRGAHGPAMRAADIVFSCREAAAELFNVPDPEQVVFTFNATHALNIAIRSLVKKGDTALVSGFEHNSVTRPLTQIGCNIIAAASPLFDKAAALAAFRENIAKADVVICTHVSNVFGFILPVYEIGELCREYKVPFIVDASQSAGVLDVDFQRLGADFVAMPGHKALFGPQGTGLLMCKTAGEVLMSGGSGSDSVRQLMPEFLPDRHEAGTHNVPGIAGLLAGIDYVKSCGVENIRKHEQKLIDEIIRQLDDVEDIELFYGGEESQSGVLSFRSGRVGCEELCGMLSEEGICLRAGMHCAPCAHRSAGTLDTGTLRLSVSPFVTLENAGYFCRILQNLLNSSA